MIDLDKRYSYDELVEQIRFLNEEDVFILEQNVLGTTYDGRTVPMLALGKGEKTLVCSAGVHGRESINPIVMLKMIEEYSESYHNRSSIHDMMTYELLNQYRIIFIPLLNPDGYEIAINGYQVIRNPHLRQAAEARGIPYQEWKFNARGVDINRNFPCQFYQSHSSEEVPCSERETRMLTNIFDIDTNIGYFDFHSRGKVIYYYRNALPKEHNQEQKLLASRLGQLCGYTLGEPEEEMEDSDSGGNSVQYYAEKYKQTAITIETVEEEAEFPLETDLQTQTFDEIKALPLAFLQWYSDR